MSHFFQNHKVMIRNCLTQLLFTVCLLPTLFNAKLLLVLYSHKICAFVSDAYGGSISDRELFEKCGIINLLQKGDIILGDRGFNIQHLVTHMDVTVNMPHFFNKGSNQFEAHQLRKSKKVSSERIYVERVIGLGKTFKILGYKLSSN